MTLYASSTPLTISLASACCGGFGLCGRVPLMPLIPLPLPAPPLLLLPPPPLPTLSLLSSSCRTYSSNGTGGGGGGGPLDGGGSTFPARERNGCSASFGSKNCGWVVAIFAESCPLYGGGTGGGAPSSLPLSLPSGINTELNGAGIGGALLPPPPPPPLPWVTDVGLGESGEKGEWAGEGVVVLSPAGLSRR